MKPAIRGRRWTNYWRVIGLVLVLAMIPVVASSNSQAEAADSESTSSSRLDSVRDALELYLDPAAEGKAWQITEGNQLESDWLIETPDCWGTDFDECAVKDDTRTDGTQQFVDAITNDLGAATASIDITTLLECGATSCPDVGGNYGFPTGVFHQAIVEGLSNAGKRNDDRESVQVRILVGKPIDRGFDYDDAQQYLDGLVADIQQASAVGDDPLSRLKITVMIQNTGLTSWNHSKIFAVDGKTAIVGGQNLWSGSYDQTNPVADVTMRLRGPAAQSAQLFVDELWSSTGGSGPCPTLFTASTVNPLVCPTTHTIKPDTTSPGTTKVLAVSSRGKGMAPDFGPGSSDKDFETTFCSGSGTSESFLRQNPDLLALWTLIESAEESIYISAQQLNGLVCSVDNELFDILATKLAQDKKVRIVVTDSSPASGTSAADGYTGSQKPWLPEIIEPLLERVSAEKVCQNLQLAPFRHEFGSHGWANGQRIRNHAKVVLVDEQAFYIGSRNLYPAALQEFGYMIEDQTVTNRLMDEYFTPLWEASRSAATVDNDRGLCHLGPQFNQYVATLGSDGQPAIWTCESSDGGYCNTLIKDMNNELGLPSGPISALSVFYVDGVRHVWAVPDGDGSKTHVQVGNNEAKTVALPCLEDCDLDVTSLTTTVNADGSILQAFTRGRISTSQSTAWTSDQSQYLRFLSNDDRVNKVTTVLMGEEGNSLSPSGVECGIPAPPPTETDTRDKRCFLQTYRPDFRQTIYNGMASNLSSQIVYAYDGLNPPQEDPNVVDVLEGRIVSQALAPSPDGLTLTQANWHEGRWSNASNETVRRGFYRQIPFDTDTGLPKWGSPGPWFGPITEDQLQLGQISGQTQVFRP